MRLRFLSGLLALCFLAPLAQADAPDWQPWSAEVFARARAEHKLVLLDMAAEWCHWCHVMDARTYTDPEVLKALRAHYLTVRVDQDARPDLANRYRDYGWPATVILDPAGRDLVKRAGYLPVDEFLPLLQATWQNPVPESGQVEMPRAASSHQLMPALRDTLMRKHLAAHDERVGGLRQAMKYLDRDSVEWSLTRAAAGDTVQARRARQTLDAALALADPVWGGFYQYSTHADWRHPHYEKIMLVQAGYLRIYALAWAQFRDPAYARAAEATRRYLKGFLTGPDGAFLVSQDADLVRGQHAADYFAGDDAARRRQGIPAIDRHVYARENGWAIEALALWAGVSGDAEAGDMARRAATRMLLTRRLPDGGFRHDARDVGGPYLADSLAMSRALLALYSLDGRRDWLNAAVAAADAIASRFRGTDAGYLTAVPVPGLPATPAQVDENISVARHFNLLAHYTGQPRFRRMAEQAMRYLATPAVSEDVSTEAGILIADDELSRPPLHLTVVTPRRDADSQRLLATALAWPGGYKRVEHWDRSQGALMDAAVSYPPLPRAAGYVCTARRCSLPAFSPADYERLIRQLTATR